ncbi:alpha/beta hydrolase [Microcella alkalica]|uniref:alpha/beta hydrolase n=1 Tax=Microcella alkalica TaxID=355930 RepID=UPI00145F07EC|nr:alpha/beta hydrolase [Microcella alkalica]
MLLEATAVVLTSLTVATVAGPLGTPRTSEQPPPAAVQSVEHAVALTAPAGHSDDLATRIDPASVSVPVPRAALPLSTLAALEGTDLLHGLAATAPITAASLADRHPEAVRQLLASPPAPRLVESWWRNLDDRAQRSLAAAAPEVVGNLDGVPFAIRNEANRSVLRDTIRELELGLTGEVGRALATQSNERLQMLYAVADALGPSTANPQRSLITLDTQDAGKAAIVLGDLQTADYVSYLIPGMFISVGGNIVEWTDTAARLYDEQVSWLNLLADAGAEPGTRTVATVAWIGYQTPHLLNVGSLDLAYEGRDALADALVGLETLRRNDPPHVSLLAHSYGSTAAMLALSETEVEVDALAMIGSPGSPVTSADDLHVRGAIFVGEAAWDPISNSSFFGGDPGSGEFGAAVMSVRGGIDVVTNEVLVGSTGHNEYFSPGTEAMRNMALIGIDQAELVTDGSERDSERTLALALGSR